MSPAQYVRRMVVISVGTSAITRERRETVVIKLGKAFVIGACLAILPTMAYAQGSSIAGVVRDASGAVLPA